MTLRAQQEEAKRIQADLEQQLEATQREVRELEGLRVQIAIREEVEEKLVKEKEELTSRLTATEHQLAIQRVGLRSKEGEGDGLMEEVQRLAAECDSLKAQ